MSDDIDVLLMLAFDGLGTDPALSELEDRLRALAAGLVGTDSLRRATIRAAAIRRLEQLGVRAPARLVDAALAGVGDPSTDGRPGQLIVFEEPELWPDPVDAAVLLEEVAETYRRFVVLPEGGREALALWGRLHPHAGSFRRGAGYDPQLAGAPVWQDHDRGDHGGARAPPPARLEHHPCRALPRRG